MVGSRFARHAGAAAVPAIIKCKHVQSEAEPGLIEADSSADVARVPVHEQQCQFRAGTPLLCRKKPTMQIAPVGRLEENIFSRPIEGAPVHGARRSVNLLVFKPAKHDDGGAPRADYPETLGNGE